MRVSFVAGIPLRALLLLFTLCGLLTAQTITGRISGIVTDSSGAAVSGASITVTNDATQAIRRLTTNEQGLYVAASLPVGTYTVRTLLDGFKPMERHDVNLVADGRVSVDFTLQIGDVTQTVEVVAAAGEQLNVVSGEIARVVDTKQVENLALNGRNYMQLVGLIPGAALTEMNQLDLMTSLSVTGQAVNGNRGNTNSLTVDGASNLDSGSNGSQINNVGIDFVHEVKIQTSNFSAEYGRQSGASINVVTRSGGNAFHGSAFEYFRNDALDARSFFAPRKSRLRYNDYGWSLGGPIKKDKLFFFAGQEWKKIRRDTDAAVRSLPTRAERAGDFSGNTDSRYVVRYPGTNVPVPNQNIASLITPDGAAIAKVYQTMEGLSSSYTEKFGGNNATFQLDNPFDVRQDLIRVDYNLSAAHQLYGRYIHDDYVLTEPYGTFSGSNLPTTPTIRKRPGTSYQANHTWMISPTMINEAKVSAAWNGQRIPPEGENWKRSTYGFQYQQLFPGGWYPDGIPNVDLQNYSNFRGPSFALMSPTTDISLSDTFSMMRGNHTIRAGMMIIRNRKDQNGRPAYTGALNFNVNGNNYTTGNPFADALLGNFRTYDESDSDPVGFFRFTQYEAFATDSWRLTRKLSIELGVRYQYGLPMYTQANNILNFDRSYFNSADAVSVTPGGLIVPGSGYLFNGLVRVKDGIPSDETGRVTNANDPRFLALPAVAPRGLYDVQNLFAPRLSFAWSPGESGKTSIRGGFGIFYDRPEGNIIFSSVNIPPLSNVVRYENANIANPSGGSSALAPFGNISTIDPTMKTPYTMNYSLSIQREMPWGLFTEVAYVGNQGRRLLYQPNINQPTFEVLTANAALPSSQRAAVNALRPFAGYSEIRERQSASVSNYNALQLMTTKRKGDLTFTANYTFSKVLTDASGNGDNPEDPYNRAYNYGRASFDRNHIFVGTASYFLPFFRTTGNAFLKNAFGGWEFSTIGRLQSGAPFGISGDTSIGSRRADYIGGGYYLDGSDRTVQKWFNTAAFVRAPDTRRGSLGSNVLTGPGMVVFDLSARKEFRVTEQVGLRFQGDFFNLFNHANFNNPNTTVTNSNFGTISGSGPGRNIQFGARVTF